MSVSYTLVHNIRDAFLALSPQYGGCSSSRSDGEVVESYDADGYKRAKGYIGDAQKHIPKAHIYLDYLEYLRDHKPGQFQKVMKELKKADPQTYITLQRYQIFRPISRAERMTNTLNASVELFKGNVSKAATKWFESTLTSMMKKDGFLPLDVLGTKATTL